MAGDLAQWVALCLVPGLGAKTIERLLAHFGSLDAILAAEVDALIAVPRIGPKLAAAIWAIDLDGIRAAIQAWQADGITILLRAPVDPQDPYPARLLALDDAPPVLFRRGTMLAGDAQAVAVVGARQPPAPAHDFAATLAAELARRGWCIVSGLAAGIDTAAHTGALHAGGRTLAVLGCGVRAPYPPSNVALAAQIVQQGALFSEQHPDAAPNSPALVARNRLISGLSRAVFVVEAGSASGSLHAARFARSQGRPVYTLATSAAGNRRLIAQGAHPLPPDFSAWDELSAALAEGE
jgi:DNA processing protein